MIYRFMNFVKNRISTGINIIILSPKTIYTELLIKSLKAKKTQYISVKSSTLPFSLLKLIKMRFENFKLIHLQWLPTNSILLFFAFIFLLKLLRFKIIWTMHNILPHEMARHSRFLSFQLYKQADRVILASKHNLMQLQSELGIEDFAKIRYIPIGELSDYFGGSVLLDESTVPSPKRLWHVGDLGSNRTQEAVRQNLNIPLAKKIFLYLGTIRHYKGIHNFLLALKQLTTERDDVIGIIAGKATEPEFIHQIDEFKKDLGDRLIVNLNYIPNQEIQNYLLASDVVVLPYERVTNSLSIFLPYAFARPAISIDAGNIKDVVQNRITGILLSDANPDKLFPAMKQILTMDYQKMGELGKEFIRNNFAWEKIGHMTNDLYRDCLSDRGDLNRLVIFQWGRIE